MERRHVMIVTGTRAEWGLLCPVAKALDKRENVKVSIVATNMHLEAAFGMTVDEIEADGFNIAARVPMLIEGDGEAAKVRAMARCLEGMVDVIKSLEPDCTLILGDRFEMLAVASASLLMRVPIIHIAGGETSEGAVDDAIRHSITKMSSLHLTATETFRKRIIKMGENPETVINTGAIGVYNILNEKLMTRSELEKSIGIDLSRDTILLTYHAATLDTANPAERFKAVIEAIDSFPELQVVVTYPNNDAGGRVIIDRIVEWQKRRPEQIKVIPSLGKTRYLSMLQFVKAVVGNSSSGLVEVPSAHVPTVNIGIRQQGRLAGESVFHASDDTESIKSALKKALSEEGQYIARRAENPYYKPDTLDIIVDAIANKPLNTIKKFHDA